MTDPVVKIQDFILAFTSILYEALPFIILGAVIAGVLEELLPQRYITRFLPRSRTPAIIIGALLGIVFPMCECGIIPVMRRLLRKGLPLSCCVSYLLAGPIINFVVLWSTYEAFSGTKSGRDVGDISYQMGSWWMVGLRAGLGFVVAVCTAHLVEWQYRKYGNKLLKPLAVPSGWSQGGSVFQKEQTSITVSPKTVGGGSTQITTADSLGLPVLEEKDEEAPAEKRSLWQRLSNISDTALHDFIDITVFLIMGALLAALSGLFLDEKKLAELSSEHAVLSIAFMMALAIVLSLCSEADAFVAASFSTLRPASKLAFLVLGPMLDIKLYLMYTRVFRPRLIYTIFLAVIVQVFVYSYATHLLWEHYAPQLMPSPAPASASVAR